MTADGSDGPFGSPRFDVVLRGYDRRQVEEHISRLQRLVGRMRSDLDAARSQPAPPLLGPPTPAGGRLRPTPRPRPDGPPSTGGHDLVGTFTDRMHAILQAAEEEAAEIRNKARAAARAEEERAAAVRAAARSEEETARRTLADLVRQRDAVLAELTRVRGQLEGLLSGPTTRITLPTQESGPDRREPGAGQPLPGTPETAEPAGPATPAPPATRTATGTAVLPAPGSGAPAAEQPDEPRAAAAPPAASPVVSPAEETALMEPVTDEPGADPAGSTQVMQPPGRDALDDGSAAHEPADATDESDTVGGDGGPEGDDPADGDDAPTRLAPGQAVRSG